MTGCAHTGCPEPVAALVTCPTGQPGAPVFAIIRPLATAYPLGDPVCVDHAHHLIDLMLMRAKEATP